MNAEEIVKEIEIICQACLDTIERGHVDVSKADRHNAIVSQGGQHQAYRHILEYIKSNYNIPNAITKAV